MTRELEPNHSAGEPIIYRIRIRGQLDPQWTNWFSGMTITLKPNGDTLLTGPVVDQSALFGLLKKVRDLGMPLLSLYLVKPRRAAVSDVSTLNPTTREKHHENQ